MENFAVFILTYRRPHRQLAYDFLRNHGYTGSIYFVVDDTDSTIDELADAHKNDVKCKTLIFNKTDIDKITDTGLSNSLLNFAVFSRNAIEKFAADMNIKYFVMCDDDIRSVRFRYFEDNCLRSIVIKNLDEIFNEIKCFMEENDNVAMLSPAQSIMCIDKTFQRKIDSNRYRECATMFFRRSDIKVSWKLNMLEDVITSYQLVRQGYFVSIIDCIQCECEPFGGKRSGGNSDVYNLYSKLDCIFPIIIMPDSFVLKINNKISSFAKNQKYLCPVIVSDKFRS